MKAVKVELSKNIDNIEIHAFADWHIGDRFCDNDLINQQIDYVKNNENAYIILNGDLMNNATKTSVSDSYAEKLNPMEQINRLVEILKPVKNKILAITSGNHENRTYNKEGIDIMSIVAEKLGCINRYGKTAVMLFLKFGQLSSHNHNKRVSYAIYITHGQGGGRKEGSKAIRLADMASIADFDIAIHSHTHLPMIMKERFFRTDMQNCKISQVDKLFVNTASALLYGGYGEAYEYKPSSNAYPIIYLDGHVKKFSAEL